MLDTLAQVRSEDPVRPTQMQPGLSRDIETILLKCLEKSPRRRYASAADLADDLRRWLDGHPIAARPVRPLGTVSQVDASGTAARRPERRVGRGRGRSPSVSSPGS